MIRNSFFIAMYLAAFIAANLLVKHFGAEGLWISSFVLIPFDFVCRCLFHETWAGKRLIARLFLLTLVSSLITLLFSPAIALASICGFVAAQLGAGMFYQSNKGRSWFFKVNVSDLIAIVFDSIVFQLIAFHHLDLFITGGQILVKFAGGLLWYFIIFKKLKLHERFVSSGRSVLQSSGRRANNGMASGVSAFRRL